MFWYAILFSSSPSRNGWQLQKRSKIRVGKFLSKLVFLWQRVHRWRIDLSVPLHLCGSLLTLLWLPPMVYFGASSRTQHSLSDRFSNYTVQVKMAYVHRCCWLLSNLAITDAIHIDEQEHHAGFYPDFNVLLYQPMPFPPQMFSPVVPRSYYQWVSTFSRIAHWRMQVNQLLLLLVPFLLILVVIRLSVGMFFLVLTSEGTKYDVIFGGIWQLFYQSFQNHQFSFSFSRCSGGVCAK